MVTTRDKAILKAESAEVERRRLKRELSFAVCREREALADLAAKRAASQRALVAELRAREEVTHRATSRKRLEDAVRKAEAHEGAVSSTAPAAVGFSSGPAAAAGLATTKGD